MRKAYIILMIITIIFSISLGILNRTILSNLGGTAKTYSKEESSFEKTRQEYLEDGEISDPEGYALIGKGIEEASRSFFSGIAVALVAMFPVVIIPSLTVLLLLILSSIAGCNQIGKNYLKKEKSSKGLFIACVIIQIINFVLYSISLPVIFNIEYFLVYYILMLSINIAYSIISIVIIKSKKAISI